MPPRAVVMIAGGAVGQDAAPVLSPVRAVIQESVREPLRAGFPVPVPCQSGKLLQAAGRDGAGNVVNPLLAGRLAENNVILEDNEIEHNLDESIPYRAVTKTAANAVLISSFDLFERAGFSGDVYLGVIGNSARMDAVLQYIGYLTAET